MRMGFMPQQLRLEHLSAPLAPRQAIRPLGIQAADSTLFSILEKRLAWTPVNLLKHWQHKSNVYEMKPANNHSHLARRAPKTYPQVPIPNLQACRLWPDMPRERFRKAELLRLTRNFVTATSGRHGMVDWLTVLGAFNLTTSSWTCLMLSWKRNGQTLSALLCPQ